MVQRIADRQIDAEALFVFFRGCVLEGMVGIFSSVVDQHIHIANGWTERWSSAV